MNEEVWGNLLKDYKKEDKQEFLDCLRCGFKLTQNPNIQVDQGKKSYKLTIEEWRFVCDTIDEYTRPSKNCAWGGFGARDLLNNSMFIGHIIMPHFVDHKIREDGTEKLRVVTDATATIDGGRSFNHNISDEEKNVKYIHIIEVITMIVQYNLIYLIMADAVNAFNRVPIDNNFIKYFGIQIGKFVFFWTCLVFGGASSCNIYTWFASMLVWIISNQEPSLFMIDGVVILKNYLDDFITGNPILLVAWLQYYALLFWFNILGVPTQVRKMQIPTRIIKYIGFIINTIAWCLSVPWPKIEKTIFIGWSIIELIDNNEKIEVKLMQSFVGIARYMTPIYYYIIPRLRNLEELYRGKGKHDKVRGNTEVRNDILYVINILIDGNRNSISFNWLLYPKDKGDIICETDASGKIGMGGYELMNGGYSWKVNYNDIPEFNRDNPPDILYLELLAVYVMMKVGSARWQEKAVLFRCDNKPVVHMLIKKKSCFERKDCQQLIRDICHTAMIDRFWFWEEWLSTLANLYADGLSRFYLNIIDQIPYDLINKDKEALYWAREGIRTHNEARKRMNRYKGDKKKCKCKRKDRCKEQPLYPRWKS